MIRGLARATAAGGAIRRALLAGACPLVLMCAGLACTTSALGQAGGVSAQPAGLLGDGATASGAQIGQSAGAVVGVSASATLKQCVTTALSGESRATFSSERSATFSGEMTALPGSVRMAIRIEVQVLAPGEELFHAVVAPGLDSWRVSDPGVKTYRYLRQVTNLVAPASYRAVVRFRWLNAKNRQIRVLERRTATCVQPGADR